MRNFPDNPPISFLGLAMEHKASLLVENTQHQSRAVLVRAHVAELKASEGGHGCLCPCVAPPAGPQPLPERALGAQACILSWQAIPKCLPSLLCAKGEFSSGGTSDVMMRTGAPGQCSACRQPLLYPSHGGNAGVGVRYRRFLIQKCQHLS